MLFHARRHILYKRRPKYYLAIIRQGRPFLLLKNGKGRLRLYYYN
jgi:hypothetical protein